SVQALQGEISRAIAHGIKARFTSGQEARLRAARPVDPALYEMFLKGSFHCGQPGGQEKGIEILEATVARDPTFAPAYAELGTCYHYDAFFYERIPAREAYGRAKAAALEALKLDPEMGAAHAVLAQTLLHHDWDFDEAERGFRRALQLSPGSAEIHHWYAHHLLAMGRAEESVAATRRAFELNPLNAGLAACIGWHCFFARQYDEAIVNARKALELSPRAYMGHYYLAWALEKKGDFPGGVAAMKQAIALNRRPAGLASLARLHARAGQQAEADRTLAELEAMSRARHVPAYDMAVGYAGVGRFDRAFEWLERAYEERSAMIVHVNWDPRFEELRTDPRFLTLVRRIGLPT
ncbi:MAG TPA: tetratricopeptide repeat protein, partial [Vicinamibacteria bacterium]|nr:tetratricopeptide repeat protein [Vicinamibacteria bacterium]